jgi:plastocyanin
MIRLRRVGPAVLAALAVAVPAAGAGAAVSQPQVMIPFAAFAPSQIDILPGETVTWMNMSERGHTVTADDGSFDSGVLVGETVTRAGSPRPRRTRITASFTRP